MYMILDSALFFVYVGKGAVVNVYFRRSSLSSLILARTLSLAVLFVSLTSTRLLVQRFLFQVLL